MKNFKKLSTKFLAIPITIALVLGLFAQAVPTRSQSQLQHAESLVIVNSSSNSFSDFQHYVQPYLDHFGVPYTAIDISTTPLPVFLSDYALIIIGHKQLDVTNTLLTPTYQQQISSAVSQGTGLVNFDSDLASGSLSPRYQFIQDIFNFSYFNATASRQAASNRNAVLGRYVIDLQQGGHNFYTTIQPTGVTFSSPATTLATLGGQPFLVATTYGQGRALQWTTYDWIKSTVYGYMNGLDDLIWRGFVWAARKPFTMQGMPPFITMRVDDVAGPLQWLHTAVDLGFKPWLGVFLSSVDAAESTDIAALTNAGSATASVHSYDSYNYFFFNHQQRTSYSDSMIASNFANATQWHQTYNIPVSKYVVPHFYEIGANALAGLDTWGVEYIGTQMNIGTNYGSNWLMIGPYRKYESGLSNSNSPVFYGDYIPVPGYPQYDGQFFNCVTEPRSGIGYEITFLNNVMWDTLRASQFLRRELSSMTLATFFTHEYHIQTLTDANWRSTLQGIKNNLAPLNPIYITMDEGCQYVRAIHDSNISSSVSDPTTGTVDIVLIGDTDIPTYVFLYTEVNNVIASEMVEVPAFTGSILVSNSGQPPAPIATSTPGPTQTPTNTPLPSSTPTSTLPPTATATATSTATPTSTATATATGTPTNTPTPTATATFTPTPTATIPPDQDILFVDDFETGDLSAWSSRSTNGGNLSASNLAAIHGNYGMQIAINNVSPMFVQDDRPMSEKRYRARFYIDPNSITMNNFDNFQLFRGYNANNQVMIMMGFGYRMNGEYTIQVGLSTDSGGWYISQQITITDDVHSIEFDWRGATAAGANDGGLTLWIDGTQRVAFSNMDNDVNSLEYIQIGAVMGIDNGTIGSVFIDDYVSHRFTYIGP